MLLITRTCDVVNIYNNKQLLNDLTLEIVSCSYRRKWKQTIPDSKIHGAYMGPNWGQQDPSGPHVGPMSLAIWGDLTENSYHTMLKI